jgi:hypothetical protein
MFIAIQAEYDGTEGAEGIYYPYSYGKTGLQQHVYIDLSFYHHGRLKIGVRDCSFVGKPHFCRWTSPLDACTYESSYVSALPQGKTIPARMMLVGSMPIRVEFRVHGDFQQMA